MGEQSGELRGPWGKSTIVKNNGAMFDVGDRFVDNEKFGKEIGTASRFFFNSDWNAEVEEQLFSANPVLYQAKASRAEREAGLDDTFEIRSVFHDGREAVSEMPAQRHSIKRRNS